VKRTELLKTLRKLARAYMTEVTVVREGGAHTVYRCGPAQFTVPRHTEINENTARGILRHVGDALAGEQDEQVR
jgi:mRNA interferase HicA